MGPLVIEDWAKDTLIVGEPGEDAVVRWPSPRLEVTLGAVKDDEVVDLEPKQAAELRDFLDEWLQAVGA